MENFKIVKLFKTQKGYFLDESVANLPKNRGHDPNSMDLLGSVTSFFAIPENIQKNGESFTIYHIISTNGHIVDSLIKN